MSIINKMLYLYNQQEAEQRGYIVVSEKTWNEYWQHFGTWHQNPRAAGITFRGCPLRVL